jgi:hypothetical protein
VHCCQFYWFTIEESSDIAGNSATCYVHFDRSICDFSNGNQTVCPKLKKNNHGLSLCQNNVNGVFFNYTGVPKKEDEFITPLFIGRF